jgi:hypothetical protein
MYKQLRGDEPLPWEEPRFSEAARAKLGMFKKPILLMLARDPAQRSSCQTLFETLITMFSAQQTSGSTKQR